MSENEFQKFFYCKNKPNGQKASFQSFLHRDINKRRNFKLPSCFLSFCDSSNISQTLFSNVTKQLLLRKIYLDF